MNPKYFMVRDESLHHAIQNAFHLIQDMSVQDSIRHTKLYRDIPFAFPFDVRYVLFRDMMRLLYTARKQNHSGKSIKIRRNHLLEDGIKEFDKLKKKGYDLRGRIAIAFEDEFEMMEAGIDTGGVFQEYLYDLCGEILNPKYGLFEETTLERELQPNVLSKQLVGVDHLRLFYYAGICLGRAIYDEILLDVVFSRFLLRRMLGYQNLLNELKLFDEDLYNQLNYIKSYPGNVADLCLTFSWNDPRVKEEVELVDNGANIEVTNENKIRYIYMVANYKLNIQMKYQIDAF